MWNNGFCSFGPWFGQGHWFAGGIFSLLFWGLIIFLILSLLQKIFFAERSKPGTTEDAFNILKKRYAAGEIDKEQLDEMQSVLNGNRK